MICDRHHLAYAQPWLIPRIDFDDGRALGPGKVRLLELMWQTGSISAAGPAIGMTCRRASLLVDTQNRMFRRPVFTACGGSARLMPADAALVAHYGGMTAAVLRQRLRALVDELAPPDG